ncbi:hypothetical protein FNV43_RR24662 [Rhamnella rubrinervis]|uniref:Glycosyltransferase n=1 Tax=Rhamnella rubrinervis TaxID=2594499 RepID=A0A8K0DTI2_9ROSA|nr:hypothetical protein FNV43_RR24662 [Rhamnella rubrinervis]
MEKHVPHGCPPRVLLFPFSEQGHVNPFLKLAELLGLGGVHVTFLSTYYIHNRLLLHSDVQSRFKTYPGFIFKAISDGLPDDHPRSGEKSYEFFKALNVVTKKLLKHMLASDELGSDISPSVTCIIADGLLAEFTTNIATELHIPIIHFHVISACAVWALFSIPNLIENGELPIRGKEDMDKLVTGVPSMEGLLRFRDLPSFCRTSDVKDPILQGIARESRQCTRAQGLILNTFEELEGPILSHLRTHCPNVYPIGPKHTHLKLKLAKKEVISVQSTNSLFKTDRSCMAWLDAQPLKSVMYASFGSVAVLTRDELIEFWYGLVNSKKRFLWVIRPDFYKQGDDAKDVLAELLEGTKERGYLVGWAPQEEVLEHPAVGGFLTHSGWNSTMESAVAGVPMICWPRRADQQVNSRYVSEVWKIGLDMKDVSDRKVVEKMVNEVMVERREELVNAADEMCKLAVKSVSEGGSSHCNFDRLIEDIYKMNKKPCMKSETNEYVVDEL